MGEEAFFAMLDFARHMRPLVRDTRLTVVDVIGEEAVAQARELARRLDIPLHVRHYQGRKKNRGPVQRDTGANSGNDRFTSATGSTAAARADKKNAQTTVVWAFFAAGWISHPVYAILRLDKKTARQRWGREESLAHRCFICY